MKIYITGIAGTGKTTLAHELGKKGIKTISIDEVPDLCYWINKDNGKKVEYEAVLNKDFIDSHVWICDTEKLKDLTKGDEKIYVFGISENQGVYLNLFDKVILLQCKPETFIKRIRERKDNDFGKDKGAQDYLLDTYKWFENDMMQKGAIPLNVDRPLSEVIDIISNF
jgi:broad-specificity NMP kinase